MPVIKSLGIPFFVMSFLLVVSTPVSAAVLGFTDIQVSSEPGLVSILNEKYVNQDITRIHDYAHDSSVEKTDVEWNFLAGAIPSLGLVANYAGYQSEFRIVYQDIFLSLDEFVGTYGINAELKFYLGIVVSNKGEELYRWSSNSEQNSDKNDHMVTWVIDEGAGIYAVAFEDLPYGGDLDFNDFVLEVGGFVDGAVGVPEPATLALLGLGLAGFGYQQKRTKRAV